MDQRAKGGTPPPTHTPLPLHPSPPLPLSSAPEDPEKEVGGERRRRREGERGSTGRREQERGGAGHRSEGDGGAVLEVHIEGRCGAAGQRQLQFPGRENTCSEGNVKLRIERLQAKRTKKPPKLLDSYVCKPTIRTYQRQGRGGASRGDTEGGGSGPGKSTPPPAGGAREPGQSQGADLHTSSSPPEPPSSSSLPPPSSSSAAEGVGSVSPAPASPGATASKQVPLKRANKTEVKSDVPPEKVSSLGPSPPMKPCGPPASPTLPLSAQKPGSHGDGVCMPPSHLPDGTAPTERAGAVSSPVTPRPLKSAKVKGRKQNSSSSPAPAVASAGPSPPAEEPLTQNIPTDRPRSPSPSEPPGSGRTALTQRSSTPPALDKERAKKDKAKKEKGKEKKRERGKEPGSKRKSGRKGRDARGKEERGRDPERDERRRRDGNPSPDLHRGTSDHADASGVPAGAADSGEAPQTDTQQPGQTAAPDPPCDGPDETLSLVSTSSPPPPCGPAPPPLGPPPPPRPQTRTAAR
ncbi:basic salivary proline-rich protein 4-like [Osmerus mordax]|uniref:basic salivary proline-rich protein 4-like n=1 Tax=Osmerus mordax TaxID=8014 RepID=UPI0035105559